MIVVKVELHSARTGAVVELSRVVIDLQQANDSGSRGDYRCRSYRRGKTELHPLDRGVIRSTNVFNHARHGEPVLNLVAKALKGMKYG